MSVAKVRRALDLAGKSYTQPDLKTIMSDCPLCGQPDMKGYVNFGRIAFDCAAGCDETRIAAKLMVDRDLTKYSFDNWKVGWTDSKPKKLILPDVPAHDDLMGQLSWLTSVLNLDREHPITKVVRYGKRGPDGVIEMTRAGAGPLNFEPLVSMNTARRLNAARGWDGIPTDPEPHGIKDEHCMRIVKVTSMACENCLSPTEVQEAEALVGMFVMCAKEIDGFTTYGTVVERYEALAALSREANATNEYEKIQPCYLIDSNTGELVIRVSDMREAARTYSGDQLTRGWLDSHMARIGFKRARVQGYAEPGTAGRKGSGHKRVDFYRGVMPVSDDEDES